MQHIHKLIRYFFTGVMFLVLGLSAACGAGGTSTIQPGVQAPDFTLEAARGGSYTLHEIRGQAVLLSFINSQAEASATPEPSRSQIVFLKSMLEQYGPKGMVVLIVDAAHIRTGKQPSKDDVINFTYNWQLDNIPVLIDPKGSTARSYGVSDTPTTFLIKSDGIIQQRWDGMAIAPQLAFAIEALVGAPAYRETSSATPTQEIACSDVTPPQAKFAGVGLARPLSNEIWVVDGGQTWGSGGAYPLQWIVMDDQNLAGDGQLTLKVIGHYVDSDDRLELVNQQLQLLPADESQGLLVGQTGDLPKVYLLPISVSLERTGCLQLEAYVLREGYEIAIYIGQATVPVK